MRRRGVQIRILADNQPVELSDDLERLRDRALNHHHEEHLPFVPAADPTHAPAINPISQTDWLSQVQKSGFQRAMGWPPLRNRRPTLTPVAGGWLVAPREEPLCRRPAYRRPTGEDQRPAIYRGGRDAAQIRGRAVGHGAERICADFDAAADESRGPRSSSPASGIGITPATCGKRETLPLSGEMADAGSHERFARPCQRM